MGGSYDVYVGPHLECDVELVADTATGCLKDGCPSWHARSYAKHCSECGSAIGTYEVPGTRERVNHWDLEGEIKEALSSYVNEDLKPLVRRYIPNHSRRGQPKYLHDEMSQLTLTNKAEAFGEMVVHDVQWFESAFAKEIARVKEAYGAEHVRIVWGVFSYWI